MTTVWVVSNPSGGHQGRMHTDKDCPRLKAATKAVLERPKENVESHRVMCKWCSGYTPSGDSDPLKNVKLLLETDADEVGV